MLVSDLLSEGRDAPLYHTTGVGNALKIVTAEVIWGDTTQHKLAARWPARILTPRGVSLSRDIRASMLHFGDVCFALDQRRLAASYRIVPVDYWGDSFETEALDSRRKGRYAEAEEFLLGDIRPLHRYLIAVFISRFRFDWIMKREDMPADFAPLLDHPKLRVIDTRAPFGARSGAAPRA